MRNVWVHIEISISDCTRHLANLSTVWDIIEISSETLNKISLGDISRVFSQEKKQGTLHLIDMLSRRNNWDIKDNFFFFPMGDFSLHYFICVIITEACDLPHKTAEVWLLPLLASKLQISCGYRYVKPARKPFHSNSMRKGKSRSQL